MQQTARRAFKGEAASRPIITDSRAAADLERSTDRTGARVLGEPPRPAHQRPPVMARLYDICVIGLGVYLAVAMAQSLFNALRYSEVGSL